MAENVEIDDDIIEAAAARGRIELETKPRAVFARYDREADRIVIDLVDGSTFLLPPGLVQDLQNATTDQLSDIEVSPIGFALHWPQIDVDFSVAGLVAGLFGTATFMDTQQHGGQSLSTAKTTAQESSRTGGRRRGSA